MSIVLSDFKSYWCMLLQGFSIAYKHFMFLAMGQMLRDDKIACRRTHTIYILTIGITPKCQSELQREMMLVIV